MSDIATNTTPADGGKFLAFTISQERYGLEILKVQEIIKVTHITSVPKCPDFIKGVINLRGKIIPVIDLRLKFGIEPIPYDDRTCIIVITMMRNDQMIAVGVIVDTVLEVVNFLKTEVEPPPNYGSGLDTQFIIGMGKKDELLTILVDIEKIITNQEVANIAELSE